jgi:hypothetical protein
MEELFLDRQLNQDPKRHEAVLDLFFLPTTFKNRVRLFSTSIPQGEPEDGSFYRPA